MIMSRGKDDETGDKMRIFLASYQGIMLNKSGPSYKLIHTKKALQELGVDVDFYDMWNSNLKIEKSDLFHIFNASIATYALAANLKRFGAKYVVNPIFFSNHSASTLRLYQTIEKPVKAILKRTMSDYSFTKYICDEAERVLPNTKSEGMLLADGLNVEKQKIEVIHNGVEERFANSDPELFNKKFGVKDAVLYVGHLGSYRKNGMNIIRALQRIDTPVFMFANVYNNAEGKRCVAEIERSKNINFQNWIEHDDPLLESAYAACDTFVLPTRYETPGRAALEAGLAGAKIVITPYGGTKEYFGDQAEYPDPTSISSIQESIETALNKKKNSELSRHIKENYIWPVIAEKTVEMYKNLK